MPRTELGLLVGLGGRGKRLTTFNNPSFFGAFLARLVRFLCAQFLAIMQITAFCLLTNLLFVALSLSLSHSLYPVVSLAHTHSAYSFRLRLFATFCYCPFYFTISFYFPFLLFVYSNFQEHAAGLVSQ